MVVYSSMIVDYFDFVRITRGPYEADAPLLVDPDAVLSLSVSSKLFQAVAGGRP